jgi:hypothetical protein
MQQDSWLEERPDSVWSVRSRPAHPLAAGVLCVAVAVGAWHGLRWGLSQVNEVSRPAPRRSALKQATDTQVMPKAPHVALGPVTPTSPGPTASTQVTDTQVPRAPRVTLGPGTPTSSPERVPVAAVPQIPEPSTPSISSDRAQRPNVSPFRRSHPWAAPSGGQHYYPSSCPATLRLPDLLFFKTEAEARASGFTLSSLPGCE